MSKVDLHVGYDSATVKKRVLSAIARAEAGDRPNESYITFESWDGLSKTLTGKRLELLRRLHAHPAPSVAHLARALGRDYKRVHEDVEILTAAGLINRRDGNHLKTCFDEIRTTIDLSESAA